IISSAPRPSPPTPTNTTPTPASVSRKTVRFTPELAMRTLKPEPQFATLSQQAEAAQLGMWVFLATEVLFFGGLIFTYFVYRAAFLSIKGYEYVADYRHQVMPAVNFLLKPGHRPPAELFWIFYFIATGLHAIHLTIGIALVLLMLGRARHGTVGPLYYAPLEV